MEQRIRELFKRLSFLGYRPFEIRDIIQEVVDNFNLEYASCEQCMCVIKNLEKYERLGLNFLLGYSK